jgi:1,2-phenylacetyl-CoA epoxidase catalytic subunit
VKLGHRPRVFEIRVLWKISDTKRDKIKAGWIKQHNEKLHDLYCSANIIGDRINVVQGMTGTLL